MLRLIVVLAFALVGLQFPSYYFAYIQQLDLDRRTPERSSAPQSLTDQLFQQRQHLMLSDPVEWPIAFVDAFDADRAEAALLNVWEPKLPDQPEEWAYGGAGLILGFLFTRIVSSVFGGGRPVRTASRPVAQAAGPKPAAQAAGSPWATKAGAAGTRPARTGSRIPASTGNLREASRIARETLRQARQAVASGSSEPGGGNLPPSPLARRVPMAVQRADVSGAVIPSRYRPPAITRRFESDHVGAIERMTRHRD